jgi:hypothetical protein
MRSLRFAAMFLLLASMLLIGILKQPQSVPAATQDMEQSPAAPSTLFGATAGGDANFPSNFYSINPSTGAATLIGPVGFKGVSAMDFNPFTGVLYATGRRTIGNTLVLITINTLTGAGTEVGPLGSGFNVQDMSFRNADAVLFAYREGSLFRINTATGAATLIGHVDGFFSGNALAFSPTDTLFHSDDNVLSTLSQTTGAKTFVTSLHYPPGLSTPRVAAMDFLPGTSTLYGSVITGGSAVVELATINTSTGDVTVIGQTVAHLDALAWSLGFDLCLQDESNGNILRVNSVTGEYQLTNCQGFTIGGIGTISIRGCLVTLQVNGPDRRVLARIDTCMKSGTAYVQFLSTGRTFSVFDRNTTNNTCVCPGG